MPQSVVRLVSRTHPGCTYAASTEQRIVALTIDDGPDAATTPIILDVLSRHKARATFFLISSRVEGNQALVRRLVAEGHEVGNHFTHDRAGIGLTPEAFEQSLLGADSVLSKYGALRWARPGSGWYNRNMIKIMEKHGYGCVLGSVYPFDAQIPSTAHMVRTIRAGTGPGAIIILHDHGGRGRRTAAALDRVLPELRRRGYRVTTVSDLVPDTLPK